MPAVVRDALLRLFRPAVEGRRLLISLAMLVAAITAWSDDGQLSGAIVGYLGCYWLRPSSHQLLVGDDRSAEKPAATIAVERRFHPPSGDDTG